MAAHALTADANTLPKRKASNKRTGRELTLDKIKPNAKGAPVARYIFPYIQKSGLTNNDLAEFLGYENHSNMSMMRSGAARLPISKAPVLAEMVEVENKYEFGMLVFENNCPEYVQPLKDMGVIINQNERDMLDMIEKHVPKGDIRKFKKELQTFLESRSEG